MNDKLGKLPSTELSRLQTMSYSLTMTDTKISLELHSILEEAAQHANGLTDFGTGPFVEPL